ncbi:hypothetical protein IT418_04200 [bacterium]|nr:hypothetical protein [bacterium]
MTYGLVALYGSTVIWIFLLWFGMLPILSMPLARIKREFVVALMILGTLAVGVEWVTRQDMHPVSIVSMLLFVGIATCMTYLLKRLDYYVEDILQELFALAMSCAGIGVLTSIWYWGIDGDMDLSTLRIIIAVLPVFFFLGARCIARQKYSLWACCVYALLITIKWITLPFWGIWTVIIVLLYSTLAGYVVYWMVSTTYAEKVLSWNISPAKVWSLMVLSAGILVLFF